MRERQRTKKNQNGEGQDCKQHDSKAMTSGAQMKCKRGKNRAK